MVNKLKEFNFLEFINKYLSDVSVCLGESLPEHTEDYDLIILWNYRKIIPDISYKKNIILFHSSDLPEGKGWAPIYNSISRGKEFYTISGIFASDRVDAGNVIVKARFRIKDNYTAEYIRKWDNEITIMLIKEILYLIENKELKGIEQSGDETFYPRRFPKDNEIKIDEQFISIINHLRACEENHPAFFMYNDTKYIVHIRPEILPAFPSDLEILFFDS